MQPCTAPRFWLLAALALLAAGAPAKAAAEALLLVEADSGKVLQAENATYPWYPASVTKLMTAYVTLRAVKDGRIGLGTPLTVSANALAQAPTKMGFKVGTIVTVDNALKMLMVKSANDMAVVLAEGVAGSLEGFVDEMNAAALRLGMSQTSYANPNGLPADAQVTSARDLAMLARALLREFPEHDLYWRVPAIRFGRRVMRNYNTLIDRYPGADGMKTGFICASGFNLVATATRDGRRLIAVVLGAPSSSVRAYKAAKLLEQGFNMNGFGWLLPALGKVDSLAAIDAAPPNLREEMCGKHRKRPAAEEEEVVDHTSESSTGDGGAPMAYMLANLRGSTIKPSDLAGPPRAPSPPVDVFVGALKPATAAAAAAQEAQIVAGKGKRAKKAKRKAAKTAKSAKKPPNPAAATIVGAAQSAKADKAAPPAPAKTVARKPAER